jgi:hypothetical protein
MFTVRVVLCLSLLGAVAQGQRRAKSTDIRVNHSGSDAIGSLLRRAMEEKLKQRSSGLIGNVAQDYVELVTLEADPAHPGEASFVSIVVKSMIQGGWPVPDQWYHKVLLVKKSDVNAVASMFLDDLSASWCNEIKSSLSPCPAEAPWTGVPQSPAERPVAKPKSTAPVR